MPGPGERVSEMPDGQVSTQVQSCRGGMACDKTDVMLCCARNLMAPDEMRNLGLEFVGREGSDIEEAAKKYGASGGKS